MENNKVNRHKVCQSDCGCIDISNCQFIKPVIRENLISESVEDAALEWCKSVGASITGVGYSGFMACNSWHKQQSNWVSVEDRLPEVCDLVLVYTKLKSRLTGRLDSANKWVVGYGEVRDFDYITHWQPLPTSPISKMETTENK